MRSKKRIAIPDGCYSFSLPEFPSVIRYYDDFSDKYLSIRNVESADEWIISVGGAAYRMSFLKFPAALIPVLKHWGVFQIQNFSPFTVRNRHYQLTQISADDIHAVIISTPTTIRMIWVTLLSNGYYNRQDMDCLKSILHFLCKLNVAAWSPDYTDFLGTLPLPTIDKYANVRTGDVFLSVGEEAILISYFDKIAQKIQHQCESVFDEELKNAAILVCSYQFGLRPIQIGRLQLQDIHIWAKIDDIPPSVHLTFKMAKQRSRSKAVALTRKIKLDWAPLFVELYKRAGVKGLNGKDRIFQTNSSQETSQIIIKVTGALLPESRTATELRHTAAQRLVDAGANKEELAEFMGHSDTDTGLVYFQTSPNQAERVNQALGISAIYQQVSKIAHDRLISPEELASLKGDQQIGAVPHGIPIAGIGGCSVGQPLCPSNPVTACYGCQKFMPVTNLDVHKQVLADFRSVVLLFSATSRGDHNSPTYLQLKRTISSVQAIIAEIEEGSE